MNVILILHFRTKFVLKIYAHLQVWNLTHTPRPRACSSRFHKGSIVLNQMFFYLL